MVSHAGALVDSYVQRGQRVLEIASNDGYLLKQAKARGATVLGVDPARNISDAANADGIPTRCEYFNATAARSIAREWGYADVIFANNVLAHVPDPNELADGIRLALAKNGTAHIEVPYLVRMIDTCAFDTIYHEHHCYFSVTALVALFNRHGLKVTDVAWIDIHGGSLHVQVRHHGGQAGAHRMMMDEEGLGVIRDEYYSEFAGRVRTLKQRLIETMSMFEWVAGYGAAAKGVVLLNHFALGIDCVPWVADVSPHKQGRFLPGTRQPVVSPQKLLDDRPPATLLLPWNIRDEVVQRNRDYLDQGGRFIVPIPEVSIWPRNT